MRFSTTVTLLVLTICGGGFWYWQSHRDQVVVAADATSNDLLAIVPAALTRIDVADAQLHVNGKTWALPGDWPTRTSEVAQYVSMLCGLRSRFAPLVFTKADEFGFDAERKPVIVKVTIRTREGGDKTHTLTFGEPALAGNPFVRPTYVRIDDRAEVLRLEPGLLAKLRRTREDFQRRQLFPKVVRTKISDGARTIGGDGELPPAAVALLDAGEIIVSGPDGHFALKHTGAADQAAKSSLPVTTTAEKLSAAWEIIAPITDRPDPDKLRGVLAAVPELWVEAFVSETDLQKTGLDAPERTVAVKVGDHELKVLIGKVSRIKETKPPVPPANPFSPPPPPPPAIREEFRYAKLPNNSQIFEMRADKFTDLFVKPADLRDAKLTRFKVGDVKRVEVVSAEQKLVFSRDKDAAGDEKWRLLEPVQAAAEGPKITELLDKLADLQARGADMIDATDGKPFGLADGEPKTTIALTVSEEQPGPTPDAPKKTTTRQVNYQLGKHDGAKSKLYVRLAGQARVNAVPDDLLKLVNRPVLAYRSRRIIDVPTKQITRIGVERPNDSYVLTQTDGHWSLTAPATTKADGGKAGALAGDLARLEAVEFVNFGPKPDDLKAYGLDASNFKTNINLTDGSKTLLIGNAREGKPEVYAKLADEPEVFAVRDSLKTTLDQPSLAYRPLQLWQSPGPTVKKIEVQRGNDAYILSREGIAWKVTSPFDATAFTPTVQGILDGASAPRAERFEAHGNHDLAKYGLDAPAMTLTTTFVGDRPEDFSGVKKLLIGKKVVDGQPSRFALLENSPGVFVLGPSIADAIDKPAVEMLDRRLLSVDTRQVNRIEGSGAAGPWSATKNDGKWIIDSLSPPVAGDRNVIEGLVSAFTDLRVQRFAAYGTQDLPKFGLEKPTAIVKVTLPAGDQAITHTVVLGDAVEGNPQTRYARVDDGKAIAILPANVAQELGRSALELADRGILNFPAKELVAVRRTMNGQEMSIERKESNWEITKPNTVPADDASLAEMAERLSALRAVKVVGIGVKDFKPYGLDPPAATLTIVLKEADGKTRELQLHLGATTADGRPVRVDTSDMVYLIPDSASDPLATRLTADPIKFRDRTLARFTDADRVTVTHGERSATFAKVNGAWKMTAPVIADAESFDLDDLVLLTSKLRADELIADSPTDLKPYGLDKPETELRLFLGDKEVLKLMATKKESDGRVSVKAAEGGLVGKLDVGASSRVSAEFRRRSLFGNVDVAQADGLIINSGSGGSPLMMNKNDLGWQFADKPDQQVKPEAVSEVLATLAALRAERYVADQKADLKLFGLEPPARIIIAKTRSGQTITLHLGRYEGDSKRIYATVPGGDGAVAVLGESDSAKLMKAAGEFGRK